MMTVLTIRCYGRVMAYVSAALVSLVAGCASMPPVGVVDMKVRRLEADSIAIVNKAGVTVAELTAVDNGACFRMMDKHGTERFIVHGFDDEYYELSMLDKSGCAHVVIRSTDKASTGGVLALFSKDDLSGVTLGAGSSALQEDRSSGGQVLIHGPNGKAVVELRVDQGGSGRVVLLTHDREQQAAFSAKGQER
jgi:hypothetical protein